MSASKSKQLLMLVAGFIVFISSLVALAKECLILKIKYILPSIKNRIVEFGSKVSYSNFTCQCIYNELWIFPFQIRFASDVENCQYMT